MALAGVVLGGAVVGAAIGSFGEPWTFFAGPVMTAIAAIFYAKVGPHWARAAEGLAPEDSAAEISLVDFPVVPLSKTLLIIAIGIAAALLGSIALSALIELVGVNVQEQGTVVRIAETVRSDGIYLDAAILAVSALALAPLVEEWFFRGLLFKRVSSRSALWLGYVASAFGFALIHGNPTGFPIYMWLGLVFAAVFHRTGRLWAAVAVHIGNNAYVLAALFFGS